MSGGKSPRRKGSAIEREVVNRHRELGLRAERYPASGATRFRGSSHDVDIYAMGDDAAPLVAEVKARNGGQGFAQLERWLGEFDLLFLRRNGADPLVVLPWHIWAQLVGKVRR
jgi:Holliday junction resolvase